MPPIANIKEDKSTGSVICYNIRGSIYTTIHIGSAYNYSHIKNGHIVIHCEDSSANICEFRIYDLYGKYVKSVPSGSSDAIGWD